jgi:hypothetical protein
MLDPLNQGPLKVLISYHLDASGREKLWSAITSLNFMGIAFSKPLYRYSKKN